MNDTELNALDLNALGTVALRKLARELGLKGMSSARGAELREAIEPLQRAAWEREDAKRSEALQAEVKPTAGKCTVCGRKEDFRASGLCKADREHAEWENEHADRPDETEGHESCTVCHPELRSKKASRSRAGMVIVAKGSEIHKSETFRKAAEKAGWTVNVLGSVVTEVQEDGETFEIERYVAKATRGDDEMELAWNGRAYDYPSSSATLKGKGRKVRNLKEALRLL